MKKYFFLNIAVLVENSKKTVFSMLTFVWRLSVTKVFPFLAHSVLVLSFKTLEAYIMLYYLSYISIRYTFGDAVARSRTFYGLCFWAGGL